ncbi:MAG TPA: PQQ-dependent sugar dehydrogenase [Phycisphaerales bacterium]|nr:PQQ-dependent sugar dehydrogenase [Phycisphaerales bacterium]
MQTRVFSAAAVAAGGLLVAIGSAGATPPARSKLLTTQIENPIVIASTPADPQRIYVGARAGAIFAVDRDTGEVSPDKFLDISGQVSLGGDDGLLGLAFDPAYGSNGSIYVSYINLNGDGVVERYTVNPGSHAASGASAYTILRYPRPQLGHQGGWIGFSPINQLLYVSSGDGDPGGTFDAANHAQTIVNDLLGEILRIDPHSDDFPADPNRNYHIPPSNPFVGGTADGEIWSYGLRNPWRCSFDRSTGDLYIGDVGMNAWEELDMEPAASPGGRNYGWACMEATHCTTSDECTCNAPTLTPPIYEYSHSIGSTVIGGYVYRGSDIPEYQGRYFFADWLRARIWSCIPGSHGITDLRDHSDEFTPIGTTTPIGWVSCFGQDSEGELYVANIADSRVYRLVPLTCAPVVDSATESESLPENSTIDLVVYGAGAAPLTFQWRKDGVALSDDGRIRGAQSVELSIAGASSVDSGTYICTLTSPCGMKDSPAIVVSIRDCFHADFNHDDEVDIQDIFDYLNAWFAGDPATDLNGDGQDTRDIFYFIDSWFQGCL